MKTNRTLSGLLALTGIASITAFSLPSPRQKAPFADKYWILESSVIAPALDLDMDGKPDTDIRVIMEDCEKDDAEMYKTGGKLLKHAGRLKCDEDEEEDIAETGTWQYNAGTKQLTVKHDDTRNPQTFTVKEVSANRMVVVRNHTSSKGNHTITAVFKSK